MSRHMVLATALLVTVSATSACGQDNDEVKRLKERIERLEAENEALKDQLVKLKREAKAGGGDKGAADAKASLDAAKVSLEQFRAVMSDPAHHHKSSNGSDATSWETHWYRVRGLEVTDLRQTDSVLNPLVAEITWAFDDVIVEAFKTRPEADAAMFPREAKAKPLQTGCKATLALRDGRWHLIDFRFRFNDGKYEDGNDKFKTDENNYMTKALKAALSPFRGR